MTKIPKIHIEGALYYVTTRGDNNEDVFKEPEDYKTYLGLLRKYKEQYGFKLFSFVLAPNHLHLLFELKVGITISDIMHDLNANYTKYFNSKYQRKGHLFQERSKMVLAQKDTYLLPLIAYTHLNPSSLNIVSNINDYSYSSHVLYSAMSVARHSEAQSDASSRRHSEEFAHERSEGADDEESKRIDSSPGACTDPEWNEGECGLRMTIGEGLDLAEEIREVNRLISWPVSQLNGLPVGRLAGLSVNYSSYSAFMKNISSEDMKILGNDLKKKLILGTEEFIKKAETAVQPSDSRAPSTENRTPQPEHRLLIGGMIVIILGIVTIFLYARSIALKKNLNLEMARKEAEISAKLVIERKKIVQDLEEKHQADMVSYNAMAKRLEIEKQRARELEGRVR